jgi:hypothetical protein
MKILAGFAVLLLACGPSAQPAGSSPTIGNQAADPDPASDPAPDPGPGPATAGDRDGDGTGDANDMCPDDPEDFDSFEDEDGCPDPDNDRDGILDVDDKCPNEPESFDGQTDDDGCPP